jgi:ADP-heptose:LPS heptosyltransferase
MIARRLANWLARRFACLRRGPAAPLPAIDQLRRLTLLKIDAIGDFILSTAFLRPLAQKLPEIKITLIVRAPVGSVARQQFPDWKIVEIPARETASRNAFLQRGVRARLMALEKADLLVDLRAWRDYSDALIASWVPAACKVAIDNAGGERFKPFTFRGERDIYDVLLSRAAPLPGEAGDLANYRIIQHALFGDQPVFPTRPSLVVPPADAATTAELLQERCGIEPASPYVVVCPGTSSATKEYPTAHLATALIEGLAGCAMPVLIAGSAADDRTTKPLFAALAGKLQTRDVAQFFSLPQHVALIAGARMVVTMDSCHVHIAGAFGVPCVCILGGGQYGEFGPWGESARFRWVSHPMDCYGCDWRCIHARPLCVQEIPPAQVAAAIRGCLQS